MKPIAYSQTIGMPVVTDYSDRAFGRVISLIIDPENGKIVAFRISATKIVAAIDVLSWGETLRISDENHIVDVHEVLRARTVLAQKTPILTQKVVTEFKEYLGRVYDITFNPDTFEMHQIYVARGFFIFQWFRTIVPAVNIIKITKKHIVVRSGAEKKRAKMPAVTPEPA